MTHQEKTIFDQQMKGISVRMAWYFLTSFAAGVFVVCGFYFGLKQDIALMQRDIANLQSQIQELKQYKITKN